MRAVINADGAAGRAHRRTGPWRRDSRTCNSCGPSQVLRLVVEVHGTSIATNQRSKLKHWLAIPIGYGGCHPKRQSASLMAATILVGLVDLVGG